MSSDPLVLLATENERLRVQVSELKSQIERDEVNNKIAHDVVDRCTSIDFRRERFGFDGHQFVVSIAFDPALMTYGHPTDMERRFIAKHIGEQVEDEISRSVFMEKVYDNRYRSHQASGFIPRFDTLGPVPS